MGKKKSVEKLRFWWRAKGRHGTHSPFVYGFVESVLRCKQHFLHPPGSLSQKEWDRLNATLEYLQPDNIFISGNLDPALLDALRKQQQISGILRLTEIPNEIKGKGTLFLLAAGDLDLLNELKTFSPEGAGRVCIYFFQPHNAVGFPQLAAKELSHYKMVLDFWDALLFVQSPDFKEKQFFELK